jgi:hypothetical protein
MALTDSIIAHRAARIPLPQRAPGWASPLRFAYAKRSDPYRAFTPIWIIITSFAGGLRPFRTPGRRRIQSGASMLTSVVQPGQPLAVDGAAMGRVLQRAGVAKDSVVRVTGPAGTAAILWLYRHGYERAAYVHSHWVAAMSEAEVLLVPHACGLAELADMLKDGDCLREGGLLIVQTTADRTDGVDSLAHLLEPLGYRLEQRLCDKGRNVCVARRCSLGGFKKAA